MGWNEFQISGRAIMSAAAVRSSDATRIYLTGVAIQRKEGEDCFKCVATDGHILAVANSSCVAGGAVDIILSDAMVRFISERVARLRKDALDTLLVKHESETGLVIVEIEGYSFRDKVIDANYPDWRRVMPAFNRKSSGVPSISLDLQLLTKVFKSAVCYERDSRVSGLNLNFGGQSDPVGVTVSGEWGEHAWLGVIMPRRV